MSLIYYDLATATRLGAAVAGVNDAINPLPNVPGIYLIWNANAGGNSYIGTTNGTLRNRFLTRVEAISTLGLEEPYVDNIIVWSGLIYVFPSPPPAPPVPPLLGMAPPLPVAVAALILPPGVLPFGFVPASAANPCTGPFNNMALIGGGPPVGPARPVLDLEHLLIRFFVTQLVAPESNTNTVNAGTPFVNATAEPMDVVVRRCASAPLPAHTYPHITIAPWGNL